MKKVLSVMSEIMDELNINYDYLELKKELRYPYVIGEYFENDYDYETNCSEGEFLLTLWDRNESSINIINLNESIKNKFKRLVINEDGDTIIYHYATSLPELQESDLLKKQEIRIDVEYYERGE